jgi:hypothetical protein
VAVVAATAVVAGAAVVGLAATEGARYDGWVSLDGKHPVHLRQGKDYRSTTLANLTAADVAWAQEAAIVPDEGPMLRLGRAPLSRRGFVYQCDLGAGMLNDPGAPAPWGFVPNLLLGGFPIQQFGILADVALGVGEGEQGTVFNGRYGVELQGFPLAYRRAHFGLYAQVGYAHSLGGEGSWGGLAYGGGGLFQVDITTRLALALRGGVTVLAGDRQQVLPEVTLGLAVY